MAWSVNQHVAHRMSFEKIEDTSAESFNIPLRNGLVREFKAILSKIYQVTYNEIKQSVLNGKLIYTDETKVSIRGFLATFGCLQISILFFIHLEPQEKLNF